MTLQCRACTSRHRYSNYDVITSPTHNRQPWQTCLGRGMQCTVPVFLALPPTVNQNSPCVLPNCAYCITIRKEHQGKRKCGHLL